MRDRHPNLSMLLVSAVVWIALLVAGSASVYASAEKLPPRVASHFTVSGDADAMMLRDDYLVLMLLLIAVLPALLVALGFVLPRVAPRLVRIPARDYWLAPERRGATLSRIAASGLVVASLVTAFMTALHVLVVQANARKPPHLDTMSMGILIAILVSAALTWQLFSRRRFRRPQ